MVPLSKEVGKTLREIELLIMFSRLKVPRLGKG